MPYEELVGLIKAAAAEAADYQERFAAVDTEARKIVDVMERFLRVKGRLVYGGAAINAHLSPANKFYDPSLYLPDYDFMTPDPLQDCADLIVAFQSEGFTDVEAKFGIHEGTYKIFVNYRSAADITYMPPEIYERIIRDAAVIEGIHYASVDFLRMNIYVELSRPAGNVERWPKVYERLLLLNEEHPLKPGRCVEDPLERLGEATGGDKATHGRIVGIGIDEGAVFLSGAHMLADSKADPNPEEVVLLLSDKPGKLLGALTQAMPIKQKPFPALGELLPARTEIRVKGRLVAVVFETIACHNYTTLAEGYRMASLDLLIQMYFAMHFAELQRYLSVRLLCVIQELIQMEHASREKAVKNKIDAHDVFPLTCVGHQATMPELKKAHRERVKAKRKELLGALRFQESFRARRKSKKAAPEKR
jgi:hypothetical protein